MLRDELEKLLPPLYSQEVIGEDAVVLVHFFNPCGLGDWFITEGSPEGDDFITFGLCDLGWPELGYVSLNELEAAKGPLRLGIERDLHWTPKTLREVQAGMAGPSSRPLKKSSPAARNAPLLYLFVALFDSVYPANRPK